MEIKKVIMIEQTSKDVLFDISDAILNEEFTGFKEDYLVLHSLIRKYKPKTFFELGTNMGTGTNIICNAMNVKHIVSDTSVVYSLDLPTELAHISLQHPINEGKGDNVGSRCTFPFTQLRGDSLEFDYSKYPCEGYFIDGEHDFIHPFRESCAVYEEEPKIIIWHDANISEVGKAIDDAWGGMYNYKNYDLYRVTDTRIAYALKK